MKAITTRSGVAYEGPSIPTNPSPKKVVERETKETTDKEQTKFQGSTAHILPPVIPISIPEPDVPKTLPKTTPIPKLDVPKNLPKPNIPYPSRRNDQKSHDKALTQRENIFQIIQDFRFDISFADALLLMPRFSPTIKSLLMNKEKLLELAKIPLNENCSAMLLKKLPEKLGDPGKFLIPCDFPGMDVCHALADLGASINLMPLSIWKKLSLPKLIPTHMTLELADRSITYPKGLAEDVFVKVGSFYFPTDFVVVDFEADPRVPLILGRSFLRTGRALINVYEGELILRDGNEQIIFHVNGTTKHPQKQVNESFKIVNDTCKDSFEKFTDEPALVCLPPSEDDNNEKEKQEVKNLAESIAKRQTRIIPCLKNFKVICKESVFHSNKTPQVSSVFAITSTLPSIEPKDSLIMGDEHLSTFSAEEIVPIPREYEDTSRSDSKNVLPLYDDLSSINVPRDDSDIECKDSYDSNLNESTLLVTPLADSNKNECLAPGDDIKILLRHDPSTPMKSIASILEGFIDDPPFQENDDLFDLECKTNDWKRILYDAPIDKDECFNPGGDNDEINAFLAIEVPTYIEEGYYDSEGDILYLESLLSDDNTHNIFSDVFFDHEPQYIKNESNHDTLITFSPKSDLLHHKFAGEVIMIPPGIDSDSNREEINIFTGPDDSIPPGIGSDIDSEEDIIENLLNDDPIPENERLTFDMEPNVPVINNVDELNEDECFDPGGVRLMLKLKIPSHFSVRLFSRISLTLRFLPYFPPPRMRKPFLTPTSPLKAGILLIMAKEESVLEYVGNKDINGCTSREKQGDKVSTKKSSSSMEILNEDSDTDVDEVFLPNDGIPFPSSSGGGGKPLEEDMMNAYNAYEDQFEEYPSSYQEFCDQFDFKVKGLVCLPPSEDDNDEKEKQEVKNLAESTAKRQTRITPCLKNFKVICKESIFHSNKTPQVSSVFAITSTLPSIEPKDSLIMGDEHLSTFSAEEIVPIPRESEDTSRSDSKNVLPSCDDFSSINVPRDDSVTFSNPLFEFDVNFNSSDINPLFDEVLEDIECKDSYDSNLDESTFLVTPLSDSNKDELYYQRIKNDDLFDLECKTNDWKRILYDALIDKAECFDPGGDNDEIDDFLAIEVPTYIEEGYYDSEGDILYLESLLSDDNTHNLSSDVFFDHEPQNIKNESDHNTFSPKSDPLHHEFAGEVITIPPSIVRKYEDYISRMSLLCGNSSSRSPENFHTIIESLPLSINLVEDSDSNREEIDIFSGPNDSIPPSIESDFDSEEDIIDNLLNDDPIPEYERLTFDMEPDVPVINNVDELNEDECFDPGGGEINVEVDDSFTFVIRTFLPYLTYPKVSPLLSSTENKDTIFDPGIFAFHFSSQEPVVVKCFMEFCSSTCFIPKDE
ncbi:reverse transcriptase domain-containing protein [Tanacetum coccineum]